MTTVKPEEMSLNAHNHIQECLKTIEREKLNKEDLNAILRLSQHLRVFGLLSAVGYINQENEQNGKVRGRTVPIWESLLCQLINTENGTKEEVMQEVLTMTEKRSDEYMSIWRRAMKMSNYWNFWGRAYLE